MRYFTLEPEVPGGIDEECEGDFSARPPRIDKLVMYFDDWLGGDLLTSHPVFFVTQEMASRIGAAKLSGYESAPMNVKRSELFEDLHEDAPLTLPKFVWLKVSGAPGVDDFGVTSKGTTLVVSDQALSVLKRGSLNHCDVAPFRKEVRRRGPRAKAKTKAKSKKG
jgi:hypothetical protein